MINDDKNRKDAQINYFKLYLSNFKVGTDKYNAIKDSIDKIEKSMLRVVS